MPFVGAQDNLSKSNSKSDYARTSANQNSNGACSQLDLIESEDEPPYEQDSVLSDTTLSKTPSLDEQSEGDAGSAVSPSSSECGLSLSRSPKNNPFAYLNLAETVGESCVYDPSLPASEVPHVGVAVSWVTPKIEYRVTVAGSGVFAVTDIDKDETLIVFTGRIVSAEQALCIMDTHDKHYLLQVGDGFYQCPLQPAREVADLTNHSCEPNAGFGKNSPILLSAMRNIQAGEEISFDYSMCETDPRLWEPMECMCGHKSCRGLITADDWKQENLQAKYEGFHSPHVRAMIDQRRRGSTTIKTVQSKPFEFTLDMSMFGIPLRMVVQICTNFLGYYQQLERVVLSLAGFNNGCKRD